MREPACGLSQQVVEVGGSRSLVAQVEVGAAPTTPGRVGTARRPGFGQRDGKVYESRNQWWNPLKRITGSNLVDVGRVAAHDRFGGRLRTALIQVWAEATRKACGVLVARLQGKSWAPPPSTGCW
jgi:hypothetical protein